MLAVAGVDPERAAWAQRGPRSDRIPGGRRPKRVMSASQTQFRAYLREIKGQLNTATKPQQADTSPVEHCQHAAAGREQAQGARW